MSFWGVFNRKKGFKNRVVSRKNPLKLVLILFIFLIALLFFLTFKTGFLEIKKVEIDSPPLDCVTFDQLLSESNIKGQNFIFLNGKEISERIEKKFICVKEVLVDVYFLSKVKIKVTGRNPIFVLSKIEEDKSKNKIPDYVGAPLPESSTSAQINLIEATSSAILDFSKIKVEKSFLIDDEGVIFTEGTLGHLPTLFTTQTISLKQSLKKENIKNAKKIFEKLKEFNLNPTTAKIYSSSQLIINTEPKLIFNFDNNINTQLASLQLILEEAKINDVVMEYIDLRFDKPVVKYLQKKGVK